MLFQSTAFSNAFQVKGKKTKDQTFIKLSWANETGNPKMISNLWRRADLDLVYQIRCGKQGIDIILR